MDPRNNPYNPGAGLRPVALAGRDRDIEAFEILADRAQSGKLARSVVFTGLRGVGKTVLLGELAGRALSRRWLVVQIEAEPTRFDKSLATGLANGARRNRGWMSKATENATNALGSITSFQATVGASGLSLGFDRVPGRADTGNLAHDLVDLVEAIGQAAKDDGTGVLLVIDEMQELTKKQMSAVCRSCHSAGQLNLPWFVIGGGLPNLPTQLAEAESYAERLFDYRLVDKLSPTDARVALLDPATAEGVEWDQGAEQFVLDEARGYPYFLQQFGNTVWNAAVGPSLISFDDAVVGVTDGQDKLDEGFYLSRWERATKSERKLLEAMALDDGAPSRIGDVVKRMKKRSQSDIGPARASLISKGITYSPEHGMLAFTVPGMADYVRRVKSS
ncbi:MAG: ATP-binding protein [Candidatus Neomicrothrix subdominans]|jgi:hypothetical protein|uniref:ATP-binding protein n=1 Tax=Candidatus Neomicrothrix subdominans TaxID=2954438 RepID=A0A936NBY4_9ACTN|nr:ATP-binding protein [Candidatus Microthrix sp.]MBK9296029.1 ATP-binding protein [Candidatus Microthrix subdominans]